MKAAILTEGGRGVGFGHLTRCLALAQALKLKSVRTEFFVNGDDTLRELLKKERFLLFDWLKDKEGLYSVLRDKDITILDSYFAKPALLKMVSESVRVPLYIDDNKRVSYPRGIVVNGTLYSGKLDYPRKNDTAYLLGARYMLLRREFWLVPEKRIKRSVKKIMVTFGGNDPENLTPKILKLLTGEFKGLIKIIIVGAAFKNKGLLKKMADKKTVFIEQPSAKTIKRIMLDSDIAISAGGQTLHELARVGVPAIAVTVADNQENNIIEWQRQGFLAAGFSCHDKDLINQIYESIHKLNYATRLKMKGIGKKLVDGQGAIRISEVILNYAQN